MKDSINFIQEKIVELETKGYDYKDPKNVDNIFGQEFLSGYYTELKNPKNADKTETQLKEMAAASLKLGKPNATSEIVNHAMELIQS